MKASGGWPGGFALVEPPRTPTLTHQGRQYAAPKDKAALFREVLHPEPPEAELSDIRPRHRYPTPLDVPPITATEVQNAILHTKPKKSLRPDGLPNLVLQRLLPLITHYLTNLFNACLRLHYCTEHFRRSRTVVIRKPGKPSYADPKAYRPIALLSTIGKVLEAIFASRLSYLVENYQLLLRNHMGGRRGRSCEHALHTLLERTHREWRDGTLVASGPAKAIQLWFAFNIRGLKCKLEKS